MAQYTSSIVIAPDTVVVHGSEVLGKQSDVPQPNSVLGRAHCTSQVSRPDVAVIDHERLTTGKNLTGTSLRTFSDSVTAVCSEIDLWLDGVGGYHVRNRELQPVTCTISSYLNVAGLPI